MRRNRAWIASHIPHQGEMCLIDEVVEWDAHSIVCRTLTHRDPSNPLRSRDRLPAVSGIEYAAQSMAIHGALLSAAATPPGYLASVRGVRLLVDRLDDLPGDVLVCARRVSGDAVTILYEFDLRSSERALMSGRAAVVLDAAQFANPVT
ncbi:MAG: 3-hydroxylacyl-ACP dehydratase [Betaproteobacteria bacterium]|nr:3-hydroxylacyl-ACP dehydratase [Betaproteobacteria bacterium]